MTTVINEALKNAVISCNLENIQLLIENGGILRDEYFESYFVNDYEIPKNGIKIIEYITSIGYIMPINNLYNAISILAGNAVEDQTFGLLFMRKRNIEATYNMINIMIENGSLTSESNEYYSLKKDYLELIKYTRIFDDKYNINNKIIEICEKKSLYSLPLSKSKIEDYLNICLDTALYYHDNYNMIVYLLNKGAKFNTKKDDCIRYFQFEDYQLPKNLINVLKLMIKNNYIPSSYIIQKLIDELINYESESKCYKSDTKDILIESIILLIEAGSLSKSNSIIRKKLVLSASKLQDTDSYILSQMLKSWELLLPNDELILIDNEKKNVSNAYETKHNNIFKYFSF